jgi:hypothetical protein
VKKSGWIDLRPIRTKKTKMYFIGGMMSSNVLHKGRIFTLILLMCTALSARWIPFEENTEPSSTRVDLLSADASSIVIEINTNGALLDEIATGDMLDTRNETFVRFSIPDEYYTGEIGKPQLPAVKQTIGTPYGARITIEILDSQYHDIPLKTIGIDKLIMPALAPVLKMPGEKAVFVLDEETYSQDALYPKTIARIENDDFMRGHRLVTLEAVPVQYNPAEQLVRCYTRIRLRINFDGGNMIKTRENLVKNLSPLF